MGHEEESGDDEPRVGRLVMRGKTCEVKAAEPKESTRSNRRGHPTVRRAVPQKNLAPGDHYHHHQPVAPAPHYASGPHDPHYAASPAGHVYPMYAPGYYPAYHPGVYGGGAYVPAPAPMYAPMPHAVPVPVENPALYGAPIEASPAPVYMEQNGSYPLAYVTHAPMMYPAYPGPAESAHMIYPAPGEPISAMQPAAPGLPTKDERS